MQSSISPVSLRADISRRPRKPRAAECGVPGAPETPSKTPRRVAPECRNTAQHYRRTSNGCTVGLYSRPVPRHKNEMHSVRVSCFVRAGFTRNSLPCAAPWNSCTRGEEWLASRHSLLFSMEHKDLPVTNLPSSDSFTVDLERWRD